MKRSQGARRGSITMPKVSRGLPLYILWTIGLALLGAQVLATPALSEPGSVRKEPANPRLNTKISQSSAKTAGTKPTKTNSALTMDGFLDRLMIAESGGNDQARNRLSTATGPFQFIESTFLSVMRRHFPQRVEKLNARQVLALRTNRNIARQAAKAYTRDNATYLAAAGHKPTFPHLRLAFLLGAGGAIRILDAKPETRLVVLLSRGVIKANPWMARHTARTLIARSAREVSLKPTSLAGAKPYRDPVTGKLVVPGRRISRRPRIRVRCNLARPSCKRWLALKRRSLNRKSARKNKTSIVRESKR